MYAVYSFHKKREQKVLNLIFGEFNMILEKILYATCAKSVFIAHGILFTSTASR